MTATLNTTPEADRSPGTSGAVVVCPCCRSDVRIVKGVALEIVRIERPLPGEEWKPRTIGLDLSNPKRRSIHKEAVRVIRKIAADRGLSLGQLQSPSRERGLVEARWAAMAAAYEQTDASTTQIGRILNRDHSTVVHGLQRIGAAA